MSDPGDYDQKLTFYVDAPIGRTAKGGPKTQRTSVAQAWGKKTDASDRERMAAQQVGASITCRFETYWTTEIFGIDPKAWIECRGRSYDITGVKEIGFNDRLEFTATTRTDGERAYSEANP